LGALKTLNFRNIDVIQNDDNYGFAEGNNVGIRKALEDKETGYVLILNNDTVVDKDAIGEMVRKADGGMVAARMMNFFEKDKVDNLGICLTTSGLGYNRKSERYPLFCPSGGCALYRAQALREAALPGGDYFDKDFFIYAEDLDLGFRMRLLGYEAAYATEALIYHKEGTATGGGMSDFSIFHGNRNNLLFLVKSYPSQFWVRYFPGIFLTQAGSILVYLKRGRPGIMLKAKLAGLVGIPKMMKKWKYIKRRVPLSKVDRFMVKKLSLDPGET